MGEGADQIFTYKPRLKKVVSPGDPHHSEAAITIDSRHMVRDSLFIGAVKEVVHLVNKEGSPTALFLGSDVLDM